MKSWAEMFEMGVDELDQDHKKLLRVAKMIAERLDNEDSNNSQWPFLVQEGLKYLQGFYQSHMAREEAYMLEHDYEHYETHKLVHDELRQTAAQYVTRKLDGSEHAKDDVFEMLGAAYGWQMMHMAMDDLAIVGKGVMARDELDEVNNEVIAKELDAMFRSLLDFEAKTKVLDEHFKGDTVERVVCQKIVYEIAGQDVTLFLGTEERFIRAASKIFWPDSTMDHAHMKLMQWSLTAFTIGFWRNLIARFTHDKPCLLKDVTPMDMETPRNVIKNMNVVLSVLFGTTNGKFFVVCDHGLHGETAASTAPVSTSTISFLVYLGVFVKR
jgi:hemerythrin